MELTGPFLPCPVSHRGVYSKNGNCMPVQPAPSGCMATSPPPHPAPHPHLEVAELSSSSGPGGGGFSRVLRRPLLCLPLWELSVPAGR